MFVLHSVFVYLVTSVSYCSSNKAKSYLSYLTKGPNLESVCTVTVVIGLPRGMMTSLSCLINHIYSCKRVKKRKIEAN